MHTFSVQVTKLFSQLLDFSYDFLSDNSLIESLNYLQCTCPTHENKIKHGI